MISLTLIPRKVIADRQPNFTGIIVYSNKIYCICLINGHD